MYSKRNSDNIANTFYNSSHNLKISIKNQKEPYNLNVESSSNINSNENKRSKYFPYSHYNKNNSERINTSPNIKNSSKSSHEIYQFTYTVNRARNKNPDGKNTETEEIKNNNKKSDIKTDVKIIFVKKERSSSSSSDENSVDEKMQQENKNISNLIKQNLQLKSRLNQVHKKVSPNSPIKNSDKNTTDISNNSINSSDSNNTQNKNTTNKFLWKSNFENTSDKIHSKRNSGNLDNIINDKKEESKTVNTSKAQRSIFERISFLKKNSDGVLNNKDKEKEKNKKKTFVRRNTENLQSKFCPLKTINEASENLKNEENGPKKCSTFRHKTNLKNDLQNLKENDQEFEETKKNELSSIRSSNDIIRKTRRYNIKINEEENNKITKNNENNNDDKLEESKTNKNDVEKHYYRGRNKKEEIKNTPKENEILENTENVKNSKENNNDNTNDNNSNKTEITNFYYRRFRNLRSSTNVNSNKLKDKIYNYLEKNDNDDDSYLNKSDENLKNARLLTEKKEEEVPINDGRKKFVLSKFSKNTEEDKILNNKKEKNKNFINEKEEEKEKENSPDELKKKYESTKIDKNNENSINFSPEQSNEKANLILVMNTEDIEENEGEKLINKTKKNKYSSNTFVSKKSKYSCLNDFKEDDETMDKAENNSPKKQNEKKMEDMDFETNNFTKLFNIPMDKLDKVGKEENDKRKLNKSSIKKDILNFEENDGVDNSRLNRKLSLDGDSEFQSRGIKRHNTLRQKIKKKLQFSEKIKIEIINTSEPVIKFNLKEIINDDENINTKKNLYLYNFDKKLNLIQFDIRNKTWKNTRVNSIEDFSDTFHKDYHYQSTIFYNTLEGLFILTGEKCDSLYYYDSLYENLHKICKFKNEHNNGSLLLDKENGKIYVFGGINSNSCECYNINSSKVEELPNLNIDRADSTFIILDNKIFGFFGYSHKKDEIITSLEYTNIYKLDKWNIVEIENDDLDFYSLNIPLLNLEINPNQIYIYCAKKGKDSIYVDDCYYVYDIKEHNLKSCNELSHRIFRNNEKVCDRKKYEFDKRGYFFDKNSHFIKIPDDADIKGCDDNTFIMIDNECNIHYLTYTGNNIM